MTGSDTSPATVTQDRFASPIQTVLEGPLRWIVSLPPEAQADTKGIQAVWRKETGGAQ